MNTDKIDIAFLKGDAYNLWVWEDKIPSLRDIFETESEIIDAWCMNQQLVCEFIEKENLKW